MTKQKVLCFIALAGIAILLLSNSCKPKEKVETPKWVTYDETQELVENSTHKSNKMRFKLLQSKVLDKNSLFEKLFLQIYDFTESDYLTLKPLIFEQDILSLQKSVKSGKLTYENLTKWYLYRILKYENDKNKYVNSIISINENAVAEAKNRDKNRLKSTHPIYGMPVLLKDNINVEGMMTTAGAYIFKDNNAKDAFIVKKIKENGGIIIGKTNLSEWANYLTIGGPNGYSAIGGQTLNPYGRKKIETGGSSSGSGVAMALNFAAVAVGTETSGSITSPSCKNSIVGLKPTTGLLSRYGIVPLSSTVDTPGPMTRNVVDNAILLSAMVGKDLNDKKTVKTENPDKYWKGFENFSIKGLRFGVNKELKDDLNYMNCVEKLIYLGAIAVDFEPVKVKTKAFSILLKVDMKRDLPKYIEEFLPKTYKYHSIQDVLEFNLKDSKIRIPYGQGRLEGVLSANLNEEELINLRKKLHETGLKYFETIMNKHNLDVILSINNMNARLTAMANYPYITIPMGYRESGEPCGITFIGKSFEEDKLLKVAGVFEKATKHRKPPVGY